MEFQRKSSFSSSLLACFATLMAFQIAHAGDKESPPVADIPASSPISWESELDVSGVARSNFGGARGLGKVETLDASARAIGSYQVKEGALLRFGLEFDRHEFGFHEGAPLPDELQAFHLTLGADFQIGQAWLVRYEIQPGFYGQGGNLGRGDFSFPMILGASYFVSSDLQLVVGVSYNPDRKYPVLPGIGFRWKVATDWVIDAVLPTPRIEYSLNKSVTLYAGADLRGDTFRLSGDFGTSHGDPKLNGAVVDYSEVRVGAGATWKINNNFTLEVESGCVVVDEFDFSRSNIRYHSVQAPPYGGISLKAAF